MKMNKEKLLEYLLNKNQYAAELTKEFLSDILHISEVTKSGKIFVGGVELKQKEEKATGYYYVSIYSPEIYNLMYPITAAKNAGTVKLLVHRAVYAWNSKNKKCTYGLVIDHENDNKADNNFDNLHEVTPGQNIWKHRECHVSLKKCNLEKPVEYYKALLENYKIRYEEAKRNKDLDMKARENLVHKLRSSISVYEGKIRYWYMYNDKK